MVKTHEQMYRNKHRVLKTSELPFYLYSTYAKR